MKSDTEAKSLVIPTSEGPILVEGPVGTELMASLEFDPGLRAFRPPKRQKEALLGIIQLEEGRVIIARLGQRLLGYVTFHRPDSFERWSKGPEQLIELGAIEVSPEFRRFGIARKMLEVSFGDSSMEDYLVVATEYYWHWDLESTGLHVWEYREMMRQLMSPVGMVIKDTDEEEIASHPANMLMVRYGSNLKLETILAFERILFERPDSNRG
ncbi:MAG TPA: GNAT family N-acetyltransferase [Desulfitobacterium sp.]|nr:GNAT family N-acetyltransferase [Desulfitobacterium sp.]